MKIYNQAPLPFQGQKRRFLKDFKEALKGFPCDAIYVDLFGGSGLLSHTVKSVYPQSKAVTYKIGKRRTKNTSHKSTNEEEKQRIK